MSIAHDLSTARWRKSSYTNADGGNCVEVAGGLPGIVPVRDSKVLDSPTLVFENDGWSALLSDLAAGDHATH
ncbi:MULTISPECIES: DUF397 domain-containing protein [unclassified Embleya]|uniref:DUF397 domain-containing protein n=1 Tax=unclassified Embleya TaxID=2699296 RepID=UPI0033DC7639